MKLPPDPENMNEQRAEWARAAVIKFSNDTGSDATTDEALRDLLCNMRHYCDQNGWDFDEALARSTACYHEETKQ
jgi:hypothetical protein